MVARLRRADHRGEHPEKRRGGQQPDDVRVGNAKVRRRDEHRELRAQRDEDPASELAGVGIFQRLALAFAERRYRGKRHEESFKVAERQSFKVTK